MLLIRSFEALLRVTVERIAEIAVIPVIARASIEGTTFGRNFEVNTGDGDDSLLLRFQCRQTGSDRQVGLEPLGKPSGSSFFYCSVSLF